MEDSGAAVDAAVNGVVPEVRNHLVVPVRRVRAVILVPGNPRIGEQRTVRNEMHAARTFFAPDAAAIGWTHADAARGCLDRLAQRAAQVRLEED